MSGPDEPTEVDMVALALIARHADYGWPGEPGRREAQRMATVAVNALRNNGFKLLHASEWERLQRLVSEVTRVPEADRMQEWGDACQALLTEVGQWNPAEPAVVPDPAVEVF